MPGVHPQEQQAEVLDDEVMSIQDSDDPGSMGSWDGPYCSSGERPPDHMEADEDADVGSQGAVCYSPVCSDWSGPACSTGSVGDARSALAAVGRVLLLRTIHSISSNKGLPAWPEQKHQRPSPTLLSAQLPKNGQSQNESWG